MIALGIVFIILGAAVLIGAQIILHRLIQQYKKSWENQNEMY